MFFVVSYSNEEHTLPSEWSNITTLIAGNITNFIIYTFKIASFFKTIKANKVTPSPVNEMKISISTSSIGTNDVTMFDVGKFSNCHYSCF